MLEREHMRAGEIVHMNIVTHSRAIWRRIVRSKHRDSGSFSRCRIKDKWNKMSLRIMMLADLGRGIGASGVEVTQPCRFNSVGAAKIIHHVLTNELGEAIRIDWIEHRMLVDWHAIWDSVDRTAR